MAVEQTSQSDIAFNYILALLPQLITIVAALAAGFKFLQSHNEKRVKEMETSILTKLDIDRQLVARDIKEINNGIGNLDNQYRIITEYITKSLERHEHMFDKLGGAGGGGGA